MEWRGGINRTNHFFFSFLSFSFLSSFFFFSKRTAQLQSFSIPHEPKDPSLRLFALIKVSKERRRWASVGTERRSGGKWMEVGKGWEKRRCLRGLCVMGSPSLGLIGDVHKGSKIY